MSSAYSATVRTAYFVNSNHNLEANDFVHSGVYCRRFCMHDTRTFSTLVVYSATMHYIQNYIYIALHYTTLVQLKKINQNVHKYIQLEMWANAQRDGRPAKYTWRPLFNAAKFG